MACDKSQQQEIAIANTLSKVTVSLNVTALMKHQRVSGGVQGPFCIQDQKRDTKQRVWLKVIHLLVGQFGE